MVFHVRARGIPKAEARSAVALLEALLDLLGASKIGIEMNEESQLVPEQSTSALVCHHPAAKYFTI